MKRPFTISCIFITIATSWFSCNKIETPQPDPGQADFSSLVVIGGDFLSGYQDGALFREGQQKSVASLISQQFQLAGGEKLNQSLLPEETNSHYYGIGLHPKKWENEYATRSYLWYQIDCEGVESLFPVSGLFGQDEINKRFGADFIQNQGITDFSIPFATLKDICTPSFGQNYLQGNKNPFYYRMASDPGTSTAFGDALAHNPTFIILWPGMEEIYNYASVGSFQKTIASPTEFENRLDSMLQLLTASGAKGVIANIPDPERFPFYTLIPYNGANMEQGTADSLNDIFELAQMQHIHFSAGDNPFVIEDSSAQGGYRQLHNGEYILLTVPLDSMKCNYYGLLVNVIKDRYVLTSDEVNLIHTSINEYNTIIRNAADKYDLAFCDMNNFFDQLSSGLKWNGVDYNLDFISGGFISLDGYHPNQKGYALIANEFIKEVNLKYDAVIPTVHCQECSGILFP